MSYAGGYMLHLYCDEPSHDDTKAWNMNHEFTGETKVKAWKRAKKRGWSRDINWNHIVCPNCNSYKRDDRRDNNRHPEPII